MLILLIFMLQYKHFQMFKFNHKTQKAATYIKSVTVCKCLVGDIFVIFLLRYSLNIKAGEIDYNLKKNQTLVSVR